MVEEFKLEYFPTHGSIFSPCNWSLQVHLLRQMLKHIQVVGQGLLCAGPGILKAQSEQSTQPGLEMDKQTVVSHNSAGPT